MPTDKKKFERLVEFKKDSDAAKVLKDIQDRVQYLIDRDGEVNPEVQEQMAAELKRVSDLQKEHDTAIKSGMRTPVVDFTPMLSLLHATHVVPDEARTNVGYYNLVTMSPEELRFGAAYRTLDRSPLQRTARAVASESDDKIREFHLVNDQLFIADLILMGNGKTAYARISSNPVERMKTLKIWKDWERLCKDFERALSTGSGSPAGSWIPTQLSARLAELIQPQLRVAALFDVIDMPNKTYDYPILGADPVCFKVAEGSSIAGLSGALSEISTSKVTFTAVKLAGRSIASTEVLEDAAVAMEPMILRKVSASISRGVEDTTLNGDSAITAGSGAQDFDMLLAQLPGYATDRRGAWDGLRKHSLISGMPNVDCATFSIGNLLSIRAAMKGGTGGNMFGLAASDLAFIVNLAGYIKLLTLSEVPGTTTSVVLTVEKYAAGATILNGEIAQVAGSPVILSEFCRDDVASTGVNTTGGPNTKSVLQLVHRGAFAMGRRRDITIQRSSEHRFDTDEIEYTGTWRGHFRDIFPTAGAANRSVGIGRNF